MSAIRDSVLGAVLFAACSLPSAAEQPPAQATPNWSAAAQRRIADSEYEVTWQGEAGWQAPNRSHNLRTTFAADGIRVGPRVGASPPWAWGLTLLGAGRPGTVAVGEPATLRVEGNRMTYDRGGIVEWYVNDAQGLEQGFTLAAPPSRARGEVVLEMTLTGTLDPSFSSDGQAIDFKAEGGAIVLRYAQLNVLDAAGRRLPARMEGFAASGVRGVRLSFDDTDAVYPVTVDPVATSASWTGESNQSTAWYGYAVSTAGDVNGDGYSDVIVGAPFYDNGQSDEGRVYLYLGSASGLNVTSSWTAEGDQDNACFGWSIATAGDVNGDGYSDVIVGAYQYGNGQTQEGRAFVYYGSASGLSTTPSWTAESNQAFAYFGWSVATAGDVNGDGYADVIIGATGYDNVSFDRGRAFVYLGSSTGLAASSVWTAESDVGGVDFGVSVGTAGDVNGDGYSDVIVGADFAGIGGRAYVYYGSASGPAAAAAWTRDSDQASAQFGYSVATAGDVNGDGYADVLISAVAYDAPESSEGRAFAYMGSSSGLGTTPSWTVESNQTNAKLGTSVGTAGDVNGDGFADVIVGIYQSGTYGFHGGEARVYLGSSTGLAAGPMWTTGSFQIGAQVGISVATAGDVNGDGYSDVIAGANLEDNGETDEGRAYVYLGSASALVLSSAWTAESNQAVADFGSDVATAGDVNGDGYSDVIIGAPNFDNGQTDEGRVFLYLGSASGLAVAPAWTFESDNAGAALGDAVGTAGDVNGDGYSDVIVGADSFSNGQSIEGRAYVFLGSAIGLAATPAWTVESDQMDAALGISVGTAGDVNGDGYADVIVGAPFYTNDQAQAGRAWVYLGSPTGVATTPAWTNEGDQAFAYFGISVATAGDVNGDGYSDVIVGADAYSNGESAEGRAYVYLGSASGLAASPVWHVESNQAFARLGKSGTAGDVNGDGFADVLVTAQGFDIGQAGAEGRAYLYLGSVSGPAATPAWTIDNDKPSARFGSVATAGDVNGDGFSDVIAGRYDYSTNLDREGRADLYLGSPSGLGLTPQWTALGSQSICRFGASAASAGDVNGDGLADVLIGVPNFDNGQTDEGTVLLYYGGGVDGLDRIPRQTQTNGATLLGIGGMSDSETEFRVRARGRTPAGRGRVRLLVEAKPLGTAFDGVVTAASSPVLTGPAGASGSVTSFNQSVAGLTEGTFYHWRARTVSSDPFFPGSAWFSLPGNNLTETKLRTAGCVDRDGDGYGDLIDPSCVGLVADCNDRNATSWATPGETDGLRFTSKTTLIWDVPVDPGGLASGLVYDTLRSGLASSFLAADCVESDDGPNTTAADPDLPSVGQAFYYVNRAQNVCPAGEGSLGTGIAGTPRAGVPCP
jgi:hypothetical protein